MSDILPLNKKDITPFRVIQATMDAINDIEGIFIVQLNKNGTLTVRSCGSVQGMALASAILSRGAVDGALGKPT
jgi:hypothetical protein